MCLNEKRTTYFFPYPSIHSAFLIPPKRQLLNIPNKIFKSVEINF